jgi:hypothetical protein
MKYKVDIRQHALPDEDGISDYRLAVALHSKEEDCTELLKSVLDGDEVTLRLCGAVQILDNCTRRQLEGDDIPPQLLRELEKEDNPLWGDDNPRYVLLTTPWFEWVDSKGTPITDAFDRVSLNSAVELQSLQEVLV